MSSEGTAYSNTSSPKQQDPATMDQHELSGYRTGSGLPDVNDKTETSGTEHLRREDRISREIDNGPNTNRILEPDSRQGHFDPGEHNGNPNNIQTYSDSNLTAFGDQRKLSSQQTELNNIVSRRQKKDVDHHNTLSSIRENFGLDREIPVSDDHKANSRSTWASVRATLREPFAEFFGTFIMVFFGNGTIAQVLLSTGNPTAPGGNGYGSYQTISWGWGLGVMLGIYVAGDSGGFLNPAITFCFCLFRKMPWRRFPIYFAAQILGGFCASGVVYANYINAINQYEGQGIRSVPPIKTASAGIFATYPAPFLTKASQFFSEFIASTVLMFVIFALKDDSNPGAMGKSGAGPFFPIALFFLLFGLGAGFGWETAYAINMARDFGPRLMSYAVGYGHEVWSAGGYYFWIPIVAPFCGCTFGAALYDLFVYTGPETPFNRPWLGAGDAWTRMKGRRRERTSGKEAEGEV